MQADRYSRVVAFLKIAFPLVALGILSTLFLISKAVTPTADIPFADAEVQERITNQQISGPFFSGTTANGDQIAFVSERIDSPDGKIGFNKAQEVFVQVDFVDGTDLTLEADEALINIAEDNSELNGNVEIITSQGYNLQSDKLLIRISEVEVISPERVTGQSPIGDIDAGYMRLFIPDDGSGKQLFFTSGVKLLYQPESKKE